ncbi:hypothetical protein LTR64_002659 [Lithohypha guttulata]|uniref:uncharacterized protein n=1 Tax=Lithohypha guttulata TaxID=1690604 RepID=UPI002DE06D6D|nr:hypothetical protein LTR51_001116 [Lithohypha guttulata]
MAFSMNGMSTAFSSGAATSAINEQDEVPEIQTQLLGFKTLNGDKKARVLKQPWPQDALPPPYASLLGIASASGLYAAAAPDALVIGKTSDARTAIYDAGKGEDIRDCESIHTIPHQRLAHVVFASDESCLVVAEQESSGIIVYKTSDLAGRKSNVALKLSTTAPVREIAPNPDPAQAQFFALLTTHGQLHIVDLASGQISSALAENVACIVWSTRGKQLMAGKGDGSAVQLKPDGSTVASVGKPSSVPANCHLARIAWIETDVFFFIYTPSQAPEDISSLVSEYYIVKTDKGRTAWNFHKIAADPFFPMVNRTPVHFHTNRLRNYQPHLDDLVIFTATISPDIKMLTKSSQPLSDEVSEQGAYTLAIPQDDKRWAALPVGDDMNDTTAIGMAIDLSDKDPVVLPLPTDPEYDTSVVPLPELITLNNEGLFSIWAVVYDDGVRTKQLYPGFQDIAKLREAKGTVDVDDMESITTPIAPAEPAEPAEPANGSIFTSNTTSPFGSAANNAPAQQTPAFGQTSFGTGSAFGKPTPIGGDNKPSWASTGFSDNSQQQSSSFGQAPKFGTTPGLGSATKPSFGQTGALGSTPQQPGATPSFGQSGFGQKSGPAFGQTGFGAQTAQSSPFASAAKPSTSNPFTGAGSSGFSSFANQGGGFGTANKDSKAESPFSKFGSGGGFGDAKPSGSFATGTNTQTAFGQATGPSTFSKSGPFTQATTSTSSPFTQPAKPFKLESTFQRDTTPARESDQKNSSGSLDMSDFLGKAQSTTEQSPSKEEEMEDDDGSPADNGIAKNSQKTPPSTINQPKTTTTPHVQSLFGQQTSTTPQAQPQDSLSTAWSFGNLPSTTPKDAPPQQNPIFGTKPVSEETPAAVQKSEPNKPFSFTSTLPKDTPSIFGTKSTSKDTPAVVQKSEPSNPFSFTRDPGQLSDSDRVKSLSDDDDEEDEDEEGGEEESTPGEVPDAPLPPDSFSKPGYQAGETSASSLNSKASKEPEDAPLPPDFFPANKSASQNLKIQPSDVPSSILSSEFDEGSGEDVTGDVSPVEDKDEQGDQTERVDTSPESSFGRASEHSAVDSPTGGPFMKVTKPSEQPKPIKPLFGELGSTAPLFAPPKPKPQESPRSPSPLRKPARQDLLSRSPERSFSAPAQPRSNLIQQRKQEYAQSAFGMQAAQARDEKVAKDRARREASRREQEAAEAAETQPLEDDEDAIIQEELAKPTQPSETLDPFVTIQPGRAFQDLGTTSKTDIPSQIEKLYQDINSMVITLGINAKSLSSYMMYQSGQQPNEHWPEILESDTPMDALNDEWFLGDIATLSTGPQFLDKIVHGLEVKDVMHKLEECQNLLTKEVTDLRSRITILRRSTAARTQAEGKDNAHAPLSAEQLSIQSDLRKSSANVLTKLGEVENGVAVLRARLADVAPRQRDDKQPFGFASPAQKKPSVEAVMNTVSKMTSMAQKRSADVDVLEAQMKKLGLTSTTALVQRPSTPERQITRRSPVTPKSGASSVYHTPHSSRTDRSNRSTPVKDLMLSAEDRERQMAKLRRKKAVANTLREVLKEKHAQKV